MSHMKKEKKKNFVTSNTALLESSCPESDNASDSDSTAFTIGVSDIFRQCFKLFYHQEIIPTTLMVESKFTFQ